MVSRLSTWQLLTLFLVVCRDVLASPGDNLDEFIDCCFACEYKRSCPHSQIHYIDPEKNVFANAAFDQTPVVLETFLLWDCISDCDYQCQHIITKMRIAHDEEIYQFHGKWPFVRYFTTQEFFSTIFSIGTVSYTHLDVYKRQPLRT